MENPAHGRLIIQEEHNVCYETETVVTGAFWSCRPRSTKVDVLTETKFHPLTEINVTIVFPTEGMVYRLYRLYVLCVIYYLLKQGQGMCSFHRMNSNFRPAPLINL